MLLILEYDDDHGSAGNFNKKIKRHRWHHQQVLKYAKVYLSNWACKELLLDIRKT